jgi:hypothetical protein
VQELRIRVVVNVDGRGVSRYFMIFEEVSREGHVKDPLWQQNTMQAMQASLGVR